jgi:hypothetical protein
VNSARNPMFKRLDLRVEKQWHPGRYLIALYLDLQNVTTPRTVSSPATASTSRSAAT